MRFLSRPGGKLCAVVLALLFWNLTSNLRVAFAEEEKTPSASDQHLPWDPLPETPRNSFDLSLEDPYPLHAQGPAAALPIITQPLSAQEAETFFESRGDRDRQGEIAATGVGKTQLERDWSEKGYSRTVQSGELEDRPQVFMGNSPSWKTTQEGKLTTERAS